VNGNLDRRRFVQLAALSGAAALAGCGTSGSLGDRQPIKLGYVSPASGPLAAYGEADGFVVAGARRRSGTACGSAGAPTRGDPGPRQPVQPRPGRRGGQGPDRPRPGHHDAGLLDPRDHQPGGRRLRAGRDALHLHGHPLPALVPGPGPGPRRPQPPGPTSGPGTSSGDWRTSSRCSPTCGGRWRATRSSAASGPTTATAGPGAPASPRSCAPRATRSSTRAAPGRAGQLRRRDRRVQGPRRPDRHRGAAADRLRHLLAAGGRGATTGPGSPRSARRCCSRPSSRPWAPPTASPPRSGGAPGTRSGRR
jgi:hypothetical protein